MAEDRKRKRIAHIGNMVRGRAKVHSDDGQAQADCNLVYDIMESMNKSQILSYQQIQDMKTKEKCISRTNFSEQISSKNGNVKSNSKQMKFAPEKSFPLMAKCQKSMKFLKKNRCMPKPRAHVGLVPKPPQRSISNLKLNLNNSVSFNKRGHVKSAMKLKQNSKKSRRSAETNNKHTKHKILKSGIDSCDKKTFPTKSSKKDTKLTSNTETDSDNEFEQFLQQHQPAKCASSNDYTSDSSDSPRKVRKINKIKRKKSKQTECLAKMHKGRVTSKTLTESEVESDDPIDEVDFTENRLLPSKKFQRIVEYENSDDSVSDAYVMDSSTFNYDSCNSSENERLETKSSINENVQLVLDLDSENLNVLPSKPSPVATSSTSLSELNTWHYNELKLKCKIPCSVVINRDPLLDQKVAALCSNSSTENNIHVSDVCDNDCIIITETNLMSGNSKDVRQPLENKNSFSEEATGIEIATGINVKNKFMHDENVHSNRLKSQTETYSLLSNDKSVEIAYGDKDTAMYVQTNEDSKKATRNVTEENVNTMESEEKTLDKEKASSALENETFNVHILSVKSLNESDVIILSDDDEENDMKSIVNDTNGIAADDSDVEIICLDLSPNEDKTVKENYRDVTNNGLLDKANIIMNEKLISSAVQPITENEEDCVILDDIEIANENTCTTKCVGKTQESSEANGQAVDIINNGRNKSNNTEETNSDNVPVSDKSSILKILETIDFNCINRILNETTIVDTQVDKNLASVPAEIKNIEISNRTADLLPVKQSQKDGCNSQRVSLKARISCNDSSEINKISSSKISAVDTCEKRIKLIKNTNALHNTKSENETSAVKLDSVLSINNCDKSPAASSTKISVPKLSASQKEISSSHKTDLNTWHLSNKNKQLLPRCSKIENKESAPDVLVILASKSIETLNDKQKMTIMPLVELYQTEYKKFMEIKSTEQNVSAGLKLLEENQARKLLHISSSIKNIAENDACFHLVKNELISTKNFINSCPVKTDEALVEIDRVTPSNSNCPDIKNQVKIFNPSVIEGATEVLKAKTVGPSSSQEVYNHLINSVCAECGKHAMAACSGCAKVFYCSEKCGMAYWNKGHYETCRR